MFLVLICAITLGGVVHAQDGVITAYSEDDWEDGGVMKLRAGQPATFKIHYYNGSKQRAYHTVNCFHLTGGASIYSAEADPVTDVCELVVYCLFWVNQYDSTEIQVDLGSEGLLSPIGLPVGFDADVFTITTRNLTSGDQVCLDSIRYENHLGWYWNLADSPGIDYPTWGGPYCWEVVNCCEGVRGNVDFDPDNEITISDLVYLVSYMFSSGPEPFCMEEADIDGSGGTPDIEDLVYLVTYMFSDGPDPAACP